MHKNTDRLYVSDRLPERSENSHKGDFGRILNIAGSVNYPGAAYLSSISALKTGAGYLTLAAPKEIIPITASMAPEITFMPLKSQNGAVSAENNIENLEKYDVLSIGCGLTNTEETQKFVLNLLKTRNPEQKLILDADGINILAASQEIIPLKNAVITPHPKELSRLLKIDAEEIITNREKYAAEAAEKYECITVLKGHNSIITDGINVFINQTGSSALAKAGSGDVLTGIISGLAAQKLSLLEAAVSGAYLHGLSGDIAAKDLAEYCVLASDIIKYLPEALKQTAGIEQA